ncbi:GerMN domain-containing protein [Proteinivorax tanatarense]|uniref:GerMN domain-containing protein n=1 Tax=Proteinivorax tanatarense TaxID=1260629 RepID=A0AAU7VIH6_9FIRM
MKKNIFFSAIFLITVLAVTGIIAITITTSENSHEFIIPDQQNDSIKSLSLYFANNEADQMVLEKRKVKVGNRIEEVIVEELIKGPNSSELYPTFPKGAELYGVEVIEGIAFVNFKESLLSLHWGGASREIMTICSLVFSLTEIEYIESVQILIESERVETLAGSFDIHEPLKSEDVKTYLR